MSTISTIQLHLVSLFLHHSLLKRFGGNFISTLKCLTEKNVHPEYIELSIICYGISINPFRIYFNNFHTKSSSLQIKKYEQNKCNISFILQQLSLHLILTNNN